MTRQLHSLAVVNGGLTEGLTTNNLSASQYQILDEMQAKKHFTLVLK
jgi:hypothetical protein